MSFSSRILKLFLRTSFFYIYFFFRLMYMFISLSNAFVQVIFLTFFFLGFVVITIIVYCTSFLYVYYMNR